MLQKTIWPLEIILFPGVISPVGSTGIARNSDVKTHSLASREIKEIEGLRLEEGDSNGVVSQRTVC